MRTLSRVGLGALLLFVPFACSKDDALVPFGGPSVEQPENQDCGRGVICGQSDVVDGAAGSTFGFGGSSSGAECPAPEVGAELESEPSGPEDSDVRATVHINHVGYDSRGSKIAVVEASERLERFQLLRASDEAVVFEGDLEEVSGFTAWGGAAFHFTADFSAVGREGTYVLRVNGEDSPQFVIDEGALFSTTASDVFDFFRKSRADDSSVLAADEEAPRFGGGGTHDIRGGWYDASGDISKYLSHLSYANFMNPQQIPLTAWVLAWVSEEAPDLLAAESLTETAMEEALWGADYLVRAQSEEGYFFLNVFDGWSGDLSERAICAFSGSDGQKSGDYQAAFREGGGMSIAALARVSTWESSGEFSSADYLEAAESGFAHLLEHGESYADDGQENIIDDYTALLAASELYAASESDGYLEEARRRAEALGARLSPAGYFTADDGSRPFWHASDAGLPVVALVRYAEIEADDSRREQALQTISAHLSYLLRVTAETQNPFGYARQHFHTSSGDLRSGFFIPHDNETGYWWQGENARLASLAAAALVGGRALGADGCSLGTTRELSRFATNQLDWILGKNPYDVSFMAGHGRNNPPTYCSSKDLYHGHHDGGISNGITGAEVDGGGIQWMTVATGEDCWMQWRWVEQWLPHATWYLMAITAAAQHD